MKRLLALATAAVIGIGALGISGAADAQPWPHPYPMYPHPYGWGYHPAPGFFFGFHVGPAYPRFYISRHARWCMENYRTYNPATDTFHPKLGVTAVCVSPWWTY